MRSVPEGLWIKCPACDAVLYRAELDRNLHVCPKCNHHMRMHARERLVRFLDPDSGVEIGANISPEDPLKFKDSKRYKDRLAAPRRVPSEREACWRCRPAHRRAVVALPSSSDSSAVEGSGLASAAIRGTERHAERATWWFNRHGGHACRRRCVADAEAKTERHWRGLRASVAYISV